MAKTENKVYYQPSAFSEIQAKAVKDTYSRLPEAEKGQIADSLESLIEKVHFRGLGQMTALEICGAVAIILAAESKKNQPPAAK